MPRPVVNRTDDSRAADSDVDDAGGCCKGRTGGPEIRTKETEGQMLQRVCPELMGMKRIMVFNDEGHHCYREKPPKRNEEGAIRMEERQEVNRNKEAARLWISGLEAGQRKLGIVRVLDLSATPFFLRGSGYAEGTLFPWTMSDFSLMDAIECGIVKLPRVPIADNISGGEMPKFRNLWDHIGKKMPKKGRGKNASPLDPLKLPVQLQTALDALYGNYEKVFQLWRKADTEVPPCFIVVCNNTSTSKLVFDYMSGFLWPHSDKGGPSPPLPQLRRELRPAGPPPHAADRHPGPLQRPSDAAVVLRDPGVPGGPPGTARGPRHGQGVAPRVPPLCGGRR